MLRKQYPGRDPAKFLTGNRPHEVAFKNHRSFYDHWEFSSRELLKLLLWGAIELSRPGEEAVVVQSPLGVVEQDGKCRLFLNGRYVNLFLADLPFQYQKLRDVLLFVFRDSFMSTWDLKVGYYHLFLHPSFRKYMGFRVGGLVFRYTVPAFGLSHACFLFTKLMNQPAKALRLRGVPVSDYIDDGITAAATFGRCLFNALCSARLLGALGAFLGLPKCNLKPEQIRKWLGFILDSLQQRFQVSPARLQKIRAQLQSVLSADYVPARNMASLAGRIVSTSPAILPASLFSRPFFQALQGQISWNQLFPNQTAIREAAVFWLSNIDRFNGRPWWPNPVALRASVDASGVGFGGQIEAAGEAPLRFIGTFSPDVAKTSSSAREVAGYLAALKTTTQKYAPLLQGASLLITGDSQAAIASINNLQSSRPDINRLLRELFDLCLEAGCAVQARWVPKDQLSEADALSREPNPSDWGLAPDLVTAICSRFDVMPTLDLFASAYHHVTSRFLSRYYEPGCLGVQAMASDWGRLLPPGQVAWAFPPQHLAGQVLAKVISDKVNVILIMRVRNESSEGLALRQLITAGSVEFYHIPRLASSCQPSLRYRRRRSILLS